MNRLILTLCFCFYLMISNAFGQVTAEFSGSQTTGCNSFFVQFTNESTGNGQLSSFWDFGNGNVSYLKNPTALYNSPGSYTVTLVVTNGIDFDTVVKQNYIRLWQGPNTDFSVLSGNTGCIPLQSSFVSNVSAGDSPVSAWQWDFGDGATSPAKHPSHTYQVAGSYSVSLKATDANGCFSVKSHNDLIISFPNPIPDFSTSPTHFCTPGQIVSFQNQSVSDSPMQYSWNFGNGNHSSLENPTNTYNVYGNFNVSLTATNQHGCTSTMTKNNFIVISETKAHFELDADTVCSEEEFALVSESFGASHYTWLWNGNLIGTDGEISHSWPAPGDYTISLIASSDQNCSDTLHQQIRIEKPDANFSAFTPVSCSVPTIAYYTDLSTGAVAWDWRFGNGYTSSDQNPINTIELSQELSEAYHIEYSDTLIITSTHGCKDTLYLDSAVIVAIPKPLFTPNNSASGQSYQTKGCAPLTVNFHDQSIFPSMIDSIAVWTWVFGDGDTSYLRDPVHTFIEEGIYTTRLTITTSRGCDTSYSAVIKVGTPQTAYFEVDPLTRICASEGFHITNLSSDMTKIDSYFWEFGDGRSEIQKNPMHFFQDTGYMSISLTVGYRGCYAINHFVDSAVYVMGPVGRFNTQFTCEDPLTRSLQQQMAGAQRWYWSFGDGTYDSTQTSPIDHTFPETDDYTTTLYAYNDTNQCSYSYSRIQKIRDLHAVITSPTVTACENENFAFNGGSSTDEELYINTTSQTGTYLWDFGDESTRQFTPDSVVSHYYDTAGVYYIQLIVKDENHCYDTAQTTVKVYGIKALISVNDEIACAPANITFSDSSASDTNIVVRTWYLDNGITSNDSAFQNYYNLAGYFDAKLVVKDILGCSDSVFVDNIVLISKPSPSFSVTDNTLCAGKSAVFHNASTGNHLTYQWDFGDSSVAVSINPVHTYTDSGQFDVTLIATDEYGCDSAITATAMIDVQAIPQAAIATDESSSNCYPFIAQFSDSSVSEYITDYLWSFGDGQETSSDMNPLHTYQLPGDYNISLTVKTSYGCSGSVNLPAYIHVGGPYATFALPKDTICKDEEIAFTMHAAVNVYKSVWDFGDGFILEADSATHSYNYGATIFPSLHLQSDSLNTCDKTITDTIHVIQVIPDFSFFYDTTGCVPFQADYAELASGALSYMWNFGEGGPTQNGSHLYMHDGTFFLTLSATDKFGCSDSMNKTIIVYPLPDVHTHIDTMVCRGTGLQLEVTGARDYLWEPSTYLPSDTMISAYITPEYDILYTVTGTDTNGCVSSDNVNISVFQVPEVIASSDTSVIIGDPAHLIAWSNIPSEYNWTTGYEEIGTSQEVTITPLSNHYYEVDITDSAGCFTQHRGILVNVRPVETIDVPDYFTPDGDGINDIVVVRGWGLDKLIMFNIYNEWGQLVFSGNEINEGWDGTIQGKPASEGTYIFVAEAHSYNNRIVKKHGTLTLIRHKQ